MKRLLRQIALFAATAVLAIGCAAEGELDDVDAGTSNVDVPTADADLPDGGGLSDATIFSPDADWTICDPLAPACGAGEKCVPSTELGQSVCVPAGTQNAIGQACARVTDCVEGSACVNDGSPVCRELCDPADIESCDGAGTYCTQTLGSDSSIGVCESAPESCDIYAQDCADGDCVLRRNPVDATIGTFCGEGGSVAPGQACGGGAGTCAAGSICIQATGDASPVCHAVCRDPDVSCASGACTGTSSSGVDFCM